LSALGWIVAAVLLVSGVAAVYLGVRDGFMRRRVGASAVASPRAVPYVRAGGCHQGAGVQRDGCEESRRHPAAAPLQDQPRGGEIEAHG
jgi:hypothetical protein